MNPVKVQISKRSKGGYLIYVWRTGKKPADSYSVIDEKELKEFLDGLYK